MGEKLFLWVMFGHLFLILLVLFLLLSCLTCSDFDYESHVSCIFVLE